MAERQRTFDLAVIGSGPGGYPAAIRAAQNGLNVALIEAGDLGGTCLNRGCIPSKALIANANTLKKIRHAEDYGIQVGEITFDYAKMVNRKDQVVSGIRNSLEKLIKSNGITLIRGYAKFTSPQSLKVVGEDNVEIYAEKFIIASGSEPRDIPAFPCDHERILDSTSALNRKSLPKKAIIVGGGVIGCEFASLYQAFDVEVTILELLPNILPMESLKISTTLEDSFRKKGIDIHCNVKVESITNTGNSVTAVLAGGKELTADVALVAVGRKLNVDNINLENAGLTIGKDGMIPVDEKMETSVPGIYAIGDIASKWWLAHVASHQGIVAANNASGRPAKMHYNAVPLVVFTDPEIGTVGYSLEQAIENGHAATVGSFPFMALGKSQAELHTEGFAQVVIDKNTGQVLGAQVVGHEAATLVAEMGVVITNEMTVESITDTIHAHPTIAEVWMEAAMIANETPLHLPPKRKRKKETQSV